MSKSDIWVVGSIYTLIICFSLFLNTLKEVHDLRVELNYKNNKIIQLEEDYDSALYMVESLNVALDDAEDRLEKVSKLDQFLKELARIWDER